MKTQSILLPFVLPSLPNSVLSIFWVGPNCDLAGKAFLAPCYVLLVETEPQSWATLSFAFQS